MKPLHTSTWRTESDCGVQVDVAEGRTTEWAPFREIVVTTDAGMTPAEARRLIADLQHAIALAEEFDAPEREDASTDDQPKPREWRFGDPEPSDLFLQVIDRHDDVWARYLDGWSNDRKAVFSWGTLTKKWGPLSEVLADSEQATR